MIYDDMAWHRSQAEDLYRKQRQKVDMLSSQQEFEVNVRASNHMALFLMWAIDNDLMSTDVDVSFVEKVKDGDLSPQKFLVQQLNGQLTDNIFNPDLLPFMTYYYDNLYFDDYAEICVDDNRPLYGFVSGEVDYSKLAAKISEEFVEFYEGAIEEDDFSESE